MKIPGSIRIRMMALFCGVVGVLLALSYAGFYLMFERVMERQFDSRIQETAAPIVSDLVLDPDEKDIDRLDIPDQYFEVIDSAGRVLQQSRNLKAQLPLALNLPLQTIEVPGAGRLRAGLFPIAVEGSRMILVTAASTRDVDAALRTLRRSALVLFPIALLTTALVSGMFAARSLKPVADVTRQASEMIRELTPSGPAGAIQDGTQSRIERDELQELTVTFNALFESLHAVVGQLRLFVSDAAHEIRTPLAILRGETELLLTRPRTTAEYERAVRVMDSELKKMSRIVDGLFTLSMADAGQLRIAAEPLYLEEVIEETCALAAPLANKKQIRVEQHLQRDVLVSGDAAFLRQLFLIFIDNAVKYSAAGTRLDIRLAVDDDIRIRFEDQGIGIAPEHLPRIFERFFRVAQSGSQDSQSGGLGLAIAQAIVQAHHGKIECESRLGVGTVFTVRINKN